MFKILNIMGNSEKIIKTVSELIDIPVEFSEIDSMHFSVKVSDIENKYGNSNKGVKEITKSLNSKFPWAMPYEYGAQYIKFTLC